MYINQLRAKPVTGSHKEDYARVLVEVLKEREIPAASLTAIKLLGENGLDEATEYLRYVLAMSLEEASERMRGSKNSSDVWDGLNDLDSIEQSRQPLQDATDFPLTVRLPSLAVSRAWELPRRGKLPSPLSRKAACDASGAGVLAAADASAFRAEGKPCEVGERVATRRPSTARPALGVSVESKDSELARQGGGHGARRVVGRRIPTCERVDDPNNSKREALLPCFAIECVQRRTIYVMSHHRRWDSRHANHDLLGSYGNQLRPRLRRVFLVGTSPHLPVASG